MTMKNYAKFEEELTCHSKVDMRNLTNFDPSTWKSKVFILMGSFWAKHIYIVRTKKVQRSYLSWTEQGYNIQRAIANRFKIGIRNLTNFDPLMHSFWAKYKLFELRKYRGVIFHEIEEGCKNCREIDLLFQNWQKEFDIFWHEESKVSKVFTLMRSFWVKYKLCELKKYRGVIFHETEERCKICRGIDL